VTLLIAVFLLRRIIRRRRRPSRLHARRRFRIGRQRPESPSETVTPPS
jgi:hypothetical protein